MSLRSKRGRGYVALSAVGFSSMSLGSLSGPRGTISRSSMASSTGAPIRAVSFNMQLLAPIEMDIDPGIHAVRTQEKNEIKGLNNRFASLIDKVRYLEQQNKLLETKWKLLNEQSDRESQLEPKLKAYITSLQRQFDMVARDKDRLCQENEDVDAGYLSRVELEDRATGLSDEVHFLTDFYETMDNGRGLDMHQIVASVKAQYEEIATRSRAETEAAYKTKFEQMTNQADQYNDELRTNKSDIADITRLISRLQTELLAAKGQEHGKEAISDANVRIKDLEQALQRAKQDMALQVREYQELMNVKLGLDIEISTYCKLLEGEEDSGKGGGQDHPARSVPASSHHHQGRGDPRHHIIKPQA
ncbi:hypothetical protein CRUP_000292 [Coryphaenoides rupestris]|nr:hypothetical protein CRUP_000292 [Coryphaenoides rupestris]